MWYPIYGMYFDTLTLAAIADELRTTILHGRIQRIVLPDPLSIGIEVYSHKQRYQVLASAHPQYARIHMVRTRLSRGVEQATPLLLLLRKHVLGGRITGIEQPRLERVLIVSIVKETRTCNHHQPVDTQADDTLDDNNASEPSDAYTDNPHPSMLLVPQTHTRLIIETMERRSNIILVDDHDTILDSVKRVPSHKSRRPIMPRYAYCLPPDQHKTDPTTVTADDIIVLCSTEEQDLTRTLVKGFRGMSPQAAREIVSRAFGDTPPDPVSLTTADSASQRLLLATHIRELFGQEYHPHVVYDDSEQVTAYAPYALTHIVGAQPCASMSEALDMFSTAAHRVTSHAQRREALAEQLEATRQRLQRQLDNVSKELERTQAADQLRWEGDMIYAFAHTIKPGQSTLHVDDQVIALDPEYTPIECAQQRFHAYQKARSGQVHAAERKKETEHMLAGLDEILVLLAMAETFDHIEQIAQEAVEQGYIPTQQGASRTKKKQRMPRQKPLHLVSSDGYDIYVGRSARQNDEVTFTIGRPDDLWMHARGIPGAHVIVRTKDGTIPEQTQYEAAGLAAYYSRARHDRAVEVTLAPRKKVRRIPGGVLGLVSYQEDQTLLVAPRAPWNEDD